ncbi:arylsulfatase [Variovorax boronicumulans]
MTQEKSNPSAPLGGFNTLPGQGSHLPFDAPPSASIAGRKLSESTHERRKAVPHLRDDAPNVLIVMLDDAGFAHPDTFGGEIHTPTLTRLAGSGITYNAFHNCGVCSPTRASLLTGRNAHRVGYGHISEYATDWDGYVGVIPKSAGTMAEVLGAWGYNTAAFGKWHNTPATLTTQMGPFDRWPTGHGFNHFYGFLGGESSQYEPRLVENTTLIEPPRDEGYHLSEDMADKACGWLRRHRAITPDKPFLMYWAPGAVHGPHHVFKEWTDKYKGRFDDGWDAYRERAFARQKEMGWIPETAELTPRPETLASWDSIPEAERPFQRRLMEVYAGFLEHTDAQIGKVVDELEQLGLRDNTLVFFVFSDNGGSAEGQNGTVVELLAQNRISTKISQHLELLEGLGGLDALGGRKTDNMYHAGWTWAGSTPFQSTKLIAAHFGGTRTPLVVSWPRGIQPDTTPRSQFHHVNDIAPTLYDILGITPPIELNGVRQDSLDGISMAYTFAHPQAEGRKGVQYFEVAGSRMVHHDGWTAGVFGPRIPWVAGAAPGLATWDPDNDVWELYHVAKDYAQAHDLAQAQPAKLAQMKEMFAVQAGINHVYPLGAIYHLTLKPQHRIAPRHTSWHFSGDITRIPENCAPNIKTRSHTATVDATLGERASGVLFALGGFNGGICLYLDDGHLVYEYNMLGMYRFKARSPARIAAGRRAIDVEFTMSDGTAPQRPARAVLRVDGVQVAACDIGVTVTAIFSACETFDVGCDLGSPVAAEYFERAPFGFDGQIHDVWLRYAETQS